jgi:hydrogenase/urease accessory protein HupE
MAPDALQDARVKVDLLPVQHFDLEVADCLLDGFVAVDLWAVVLNSDGQDPQYPPASQPAEEEYHVLATAQRFVGVGTLGTRVDFAAAKVDVFQTLVELEVVELGLEVALGDGVAAAAKVEPE